MKVLVKLGGSVITYKNARDFPTSITDVLKVGDRFVRKDVMSRIASEIENIFKKIQGMRLVIVNGAGPFGHAMVKRYLEVGDVKVKDIIESVKFLNSKLTNELKKLGLKVVTIHPHETCFYDGSFRVEKLVEKVEFFTNLGYVVSTYGDSIPTTVKTKYSNFQVISGDDLILEIGKVWKPDRVVVATDVDGVFTKDPKLHRDAKLIPRITPDSMEKIQFSLTGIDVTGGMKSKVEKLVRLSRYGLDSLIVNGLKDGTIGKAITGDAHGTVFTNNRIITPFQPDS